MMAEYLQEIDIEEYETYRVTVDTPYGKRVTYIDIKEGGQMPDDIVIDQELTGREVKIKIDKYNYDPAITPDGWMDLDGTEPLYRIWLHYDADGNLKGGSLGDDYDRREYAAALDICTRYDQLLGYVPDLIRWLHDHGYPEEVLRL